MLRKSVIQSPVKSTILPPPPERDSVIEDAWSAALADSIRPVRHSEVAQALPTVFEAYPTMLDGLDDAPRPYDDLLLALAS